MEEYGDNNSSGPLQKDTSWKQDDMVPCPLTMNPFSLDLRKVGASSQKTFASNSKSPTVVVSPIATPASMDPAPFPSPQKLVRRSTEVITRLESEVQKLRQDAIDKEMKLVSTMKSIKTFWNPELKKERAAREESEKALAKLQLELSSIEQRLKEKEKTISVLEATVLGGRSLRSVDSGLSAQSTDDIAQSGISRGSSSTLSDDLLQSPRASLPADVPSGSAPCLPHGEPSSLEGCSHVDGVILCMHCCKCSCCSLRRPLSTIVSLSPPSGDIDDINHDLLLLRGQLELARTERNQVQYELEDTRRLLFSYRDKADVAMQEYCSKERELLAVTQSAVELRTELSYMTEDIAAVKDSNAAKDHHIKSLQEQLNILEKYASSKELALAVLREEKVHTASSTGAQISELESELEKLRERLWKSEQDREDLNEELMGGRSGVKSELARALDEVEQSASRIARLEEESSALREEVCLWRNESCQNRDMADQCESELRQCKLLNDSLQEQVDMLRVQMLSTSNSYSSNSCDIDTCTSCQGAIEDARKLADSLRSQLQQKEAKIEDQERQIKELTRKLAALRRSQTVDRGREMESRIQEEVSRRDSDIALEIFQEDLLQKQQRIDCLEDALRESVGIANEREELLAHHILVSEKALEKVNELETSLAAGAFFRCIIDLKNACLILSLTEKEILMSMVMRSSSLISDSNFANKQNILLAAISEKDEAIAAMEVLGSERFPDRDIEQLKQEKEQLVAELKGHHHQKLSVTNNDSGMCSIFSEARNCSAEELCSIVSHLRTANETVVDCLQRTLLLLGDRDAALHKDLPVLELSQRSFLEPTPSTPKEELLLELRCREDDAIGLRSFVDVLLSKIEC